jgi:hypothetical protein
MKALFELDIPSIQIFQAQLFQLPYFRSLLQYCIRTAAFVVRIEVPAAMLSNNGIPLLFFGSFFFFVDLLYLYSSF